MKSPDDAVTMLDALIMATRGGSIRRIVISGAMANAPTVRLSPGQSLRGADEQSFISFADGNDGLQLSLDKRVHQACLNVSADRRAIFNDTSVDGLWRIELRGVTTLGRGQIPARDNVRSGHVDVSGVDILETDVIVSADPVRLSASRNGAPVLGSGIFVSGAGDKGGRLAVRRRRLRRSTAMAGSPAASRRTDPVALLSNSMAQSNPWALQEA
ncbi:hypothetical protein [Microvirga sp. TS319]|uniref:hypothetical protein n=1 Tax=Microvirga sp. TS319 TaxID=3241165 RepID=UPI00351A57D1